MANYDLGVIGLTVQSTGAEQATQEVKKLGDAAQKVMDDFNRMKSIMALTKKSVDDTSASFKRFSVTDLQQASQRMEGLERTLSKTRRGMNEVGVGIQQVGYQVGDFIVQWQSGTNVMVAFGQQATQLVGILPMFAKQLGMTVGSLVGISSILGIVIPLVTAIGAAWMRSGEDAKKSSDDVTSYAGAVKALTAEIEKNQQTSLKAKFGTDVIGIASAKQQVIDLENQIKSLQANIDKMKSYGGRSAAAAGLLGDPGELEAQKQALETQLQTIRDQEEAQRMLNGHLSTASGVHRNIIDEKQEQLRLDKEAAIAEELAAELAREKKNAFHAMAGEMSSVSSSMYDANNGSREMLGNLESATNAALNLRDALGGVATASRSRADQIAILTAEVNAAKSGASVSGAGAAAKTATGLARSGATLDQIAAASAAAAQQAIQIDTLQKEKSGLLNPKKGKTGGSGGSTLGVENKLEEIYKYLEQDKYLMEQEEIAYQQRQDVLENSLQKKLLSIEEYQQLEKDLRLKHETDILDIERRTRDTRLSEVGTFFGAMASVAQAGGDKFVKIAKVLGASEAFVNTLVAQSQVLRDPKLGFFGKMAAYAAIGASGLSVVAALKGGGSSGSVSRGSASVTPASAAATAAPQTVFIDSIDPESLYSGKSLINLFDAFYNENDKRGKVFVVAR